MTPAVKEKMKKVFNECYKALLSCTDENGRKRCELFRELPDKRVRALLSPRAADTSPDIPLLFLRRRTTPTTTA